MWAAVQPPPRDTTRGHSSSKVSGVYSLHEAMQRRRVESVIRPNTAGPKPQWQGLFLAPDYGVDFIHDVQDLEPRRPTIPRRRRGGRRAP